MKLFVITGATYSEDGDLHGYSILFNTLEAAKEGLKKDFEESTKIDDWEDEDAWFADDGMSWGSSGPNQTYAYISEREVE